MIFLSSDSLWQAHLIFLVVARWPPPDKQDELVNSIIEEIIKQQCPLCFEELKVYIILFRNQNTSRTKDLELADGIKSYVSVYYQLWHHILGSSINSAILLLLHGLDDGTVRLSLNVGTSLPIYAAYSRRRAKV